MKIYSLNKVNINQISKKDRELLGIFDQRELDALLSSGDPTAEDGKGIYDSVLLKWYLDAASIIAPDSRFNYYAYTEQFFDLLQKYESLRVRNLVGQPKQALQGKSFEEVERIVEENWVDEKIDDSGVNWDRIYRNGDKRIYDDGTFEIYEINSAKSAMEIAKRSQWCFANSNWAKEYAEQTGPLYIVLKNGERFCAVHNGSGQWKYPWNDEEIEEIDFNDLKPIFQKLNIFAVGEDIVNYLSEQEILKYDKTGYGAYWVAKNVKGADIDFLLRSVIEKDQTGEWCYMFADGVHNLTKEHIDILLEAVLKKDQTGEWCYKFALNIKGLTGEHIDILLEAVLKKDKTGEWCIEFAKWVRGLTKEQIDILLEAVIDRDQTGEWCYKFAYWVKGLTKEQIDILLEAVIDRDQTGEWCAWFAYWVKGLTKEHIDILFKAVIDRDQTGKWCYRFAWRVKGLTKEQIDILFKAVLDRDQTGEWCYWFADEVPNLTKEQIDILLEAAKERGYEV